MVETAEIATVRMQAGRPLQQSFFSQGVQCCRSCGLRGVFIFSRAHLLELFRIGQRVFHGLLLAMELQFLIQLVLDAVQSFCGIAFKIL